jgi:glucokinase
MSNTSSNIAIAVDVGGTKIRTAAIDANGTLLAGDLQPTDASGGASHVLAAIEASIDAVIAAIRNKGLTDVPLGIGLSSPGVIEPVSGSVVSSAPQIPGWVGLELGEHFRQRYGLPVVVENDANCALVGEFWRGGHGLGPTASALMLTLGTGLGGAIMMGGRIVSGKHHLTGHFGIAKVWDPLSLQLVKVEHLVSGTGLGNVYRQIVAGEDAVSGRDVVALVERGDAQAILALSRWCDHLSLQIHNLHWMINPDLILIGGGMVDARDFWWPGFIEKLDTLEVAADIQVASLGNDAGIFGAARLVFDQIDHPR